MIIFMTEEASMKETLKAVINAHFPTATEGIDWLVCAFQGKQDLEMRLLDKLRNWNYESPHFVVLRDADSGDCHNIKANLLEIAERAGKSITVRIVCQELESWFLGDESAVKAAYPQAKMNAKQVKFREPDRLGNPSEELSRITGDHSKVGRAAKIAVHLAPDSNRSHSFKVTFKTLGDHLGSPR